MRPGNGERGSGFAVFCSILTILFLSFWATPLALRQSHNYPGDSQTTRRDIGNIARESKKYYNI